MIPYETITAGELKNRDRIIAGLRGNRVAKVSNVGTENGLAVFTETVEGGTPVERVLTSSTRLWRVVDRSVPTAHSIVGRDVLDADGKLLCVLPDGFVFPVTVPAGAKQRILAALADGPLDIQALTLRVAGHIVVPLAELINADRLVSVSCGIYQLCGARP